MDHTSTASTNAMILYSAPVVSTSNSFDALNIANDDVQVDLLARKILESAYQAKDYNLRHGKITDIPTGYDFKRRTPTAISPINSPSLPTASHHDASYDADGATASDSEEESLYNFTNDPFH